MLSLSRRPYAVIVFFIVLQIGNCCRLSVMSMRDNRIARLPNELGNLRDLHVLDVCGNRSVDCN